MQENFFFLISRHYTNDNELSNKTKQPVSIFDHSTCSFFKNFYAHYCCMKDSIGRYYR